MPKEVARNFATNFNARRSRSPSVTALPCTRYHHAQGLGVLPALPGRSRITETELSSSVLGGLQDRAERDQCEGAVRDVGLAGVDELELRPPHLLELFDGGLLDEALRLSPIEGESRIVPTEAQVQVGFEGLAALGGARQIREEEPGGDLHRRLAGWQPRLILSRRLGEPQERGDREEKHGQPIQGPKEAKSTAD
jgi:hypothetical protein